MHQLAVISAPEAWPAHWRFPGFTLHHHRAYAALGEQRFDGIALVEPEPQEVDGVLSALEARDEVGAFATLVVGRAEDARVPGLLARQRVDGFLDLSWPEGVAAATVRVALAHVELGRNLVEIQRVVLQQAREQMLALYEQAIHDGLTHLFSHRAFTELLARRHERSRRQGETYALVLIDADELEASSARHGLAGGSRALDELARTIAATIRATDAAVRLGGDEFAVFLSGCDRAQGLAFARRLCARLRSHRTELEGRPLGVRVSCGVASYPEDGLAAPELLQRSERALQRAKREGKDRAAGFDAALEQPSLG